MKILVMSDSHGNSSRMRSLYREGNWNAVIFLGDGSRDADELADITGGIPVYRVKGNCDVFMCDAPEIQYIFLGGKKIMLTHGHLYSVKSGLIRLSLAAREQGADIVLFGHTHNQFTDESDGLLMLNPGSIAQGRYATLEIGEKIKAELYQL